MGSDSEYTLSIPFVKNFLEVYLMEVKANKTSRQIRLMVVTAMLTAVNIVMSSSVLSVPVPGGHMYLNDMVITFAAVVLDPFYAFVVGGIGAFLGDMFFYPTPMFVSLVTHGVQAVVISLCARKLFTGKKQLGAIVGMVLGVVINVVGYSLGRAFIYSTPEYAIVKLPFQILQAVVGTAVGYVLLYPCKLKSVFEKRFTK